ncbi:MAG: translation initiation factor IF-3 [Patescibacteria group bacterium]
MRHKKIWVNYGIRLPRVQVIDETGKNLGVMETNKAIELAKSRGFDLVEVGPNTRPVVCKFLDFGKYRYELGKKEKDQRKKAKRVEIKGVRISLRISRNDLEFKARQADKFLKEGHKVRIEIVIRGREFIHRDMIKKVISDFLATMKEKVIIEQELKRQRLGLAMVVARQNNSQNV